MRINLSKFLQLRCNVFLYKRLNWKAVFLYIVILGKLYFFFNRKEKYKIEDAVENVFEGIRSTSEMKTIKRNVFQGILSHYYEKLFNAFSSAEMLEDFIHRNIKSEGLSIIEEGLGIGKGVLLITAHFGGVEFTPGYLAAKKYPVTTIARFSSNYLRDISIRKADKFSAKIIDADNTSNIMKAIYDSLKENRIVITHCDEIDEWRPSRQQRIFFLGKKISLDKTINILLKRRDVSIVFGIIHRDSDQQYKFIITSWEAMAKQFRPSVNMPIGEVVLKFLERYIYEHPEEWYQWKKYTKIKTLPSYDTKVEGPVNLSLLKPSLGKV